MALEHGPLPGKGAQPCAPTSGLPGNAVRGQEARCTKIGAVRRLAFTLCSIILVASGRAQAQHEWAREDPARIRTSEACGECHVSAFEVWKRTPHATGFKTLHRLKTAEAIAGRMGFKLIKRDSNCLQRPGGDAEPASQPKIRSQRGLSFATGC